MLYFNLESNRGQFRLLSKTFRLISVTYINTHKYSFCVERKSEKERKRQRDWDRMRCGQKREGVMLIRE